MGFNGAKTLAYVAAGLAQVPDLLLALRRREAEDLTLAWFVTSLQATTIEIELYYAWQIIQLPEPLDTAIFREVQCDQLTPRSKILTAMLSSAFRTFSMGGALAAELKKKL